MIKSTCWIQWGCTLTERVVSLVSLKTKVGWMWPTVQDEFDTLTVSNVIFHVTVDLSFYFLLM